MSLDRRAATVMSHFTGDEVEADRVEHEESQRAEQRGPEDPPPRRFVQRQPDDREQALHPGRASSPMTSRNKVSSEVRATAR